MRGIRMRSVAPLNEDTGEKGRWVRTDLSHAHVCRGWNGAPALSP